MNFLTLNSLSILKFGASWRVVEKFSLYKAIQMKFIADTSQESLYDNVDIPPKLENGQILGKDLKSATAMLRNRYSNIPQPTRQKSDISARSDHPVRQPTQQRPPLQQQLPRSLQTTNNNSFKAMPQIKSMANTDNGRLMVSGQTPMLHCRNTNCCLLYTSDAADE